MQKPSNPRLPNQNNQPNFRRALIIWGLIIAMLVFLYVPRLFYASDEIDISYSEFKQQVKTGNVSEITIQGETIQGQFENAYTTGAEQQADAESYSAFHTVMPAVDDPELLPMLEANDVTIHAKQEQNSWLGSALIFLLPWLLILGFFVYSQRKMSG
ncbi:hypothetical protein GF339_10505, partial [candidate division KSB3 bacterium]|nr:hypothetical protein [candidate division KSB3 bacterium]MBD3325006.1 hypothetical protein [candidate division KSB3 bacterium]